MSTAVQARSVPPRVRARRHGARGRLPLWSHLLLASTALSIGNLLLVIGWAGSALAAPAEPVTPSELWGTGLGTAAAIVVWVELPVAVLLGLPLSLLLDRVLLMRVRSLAGHVLAYAGTGLLPLAVIWPWWFVAVAEDGAAGLWEVLGEGGLGGLVVALLVPFVIAGAAARAAVAPLEQALR